jgi:sedoheptulokinase
MDRAHGIETRPFPGNRYVLTGAALCGGDAFALLREFFAETASMLDLAPPGAPPGEQAMYAAMLSAASRISPGADGLRADTRFDGARHDPSARASFSNLSRANFTPAHLTRALLEGVAEELWAFYDAMREQAGAAHALIGSGNGIRRNPLLAEIISSRFGLPLRMPEWEEEAAVGAAIVAARTPSP